MIKMVVIASSIVAEQTTTYHPNGPIWPPLDTASRIADLANFTLLASLVVGAVSTGLIVWMTNVKETYWDRAQTQAEIEIADAHVASELAKTQAAKANEEAAKANLEIAKLNFQRKIPADKTVAFIERLKPFLGQAISFSSPSENEPFALAIQLKDLITVDAGWISRAPKGILNGDIGQAVGTTIVVHLPPKENMSAVQVQRMEAAAEALTKALNEAGLPCVSHTTPLLRPTPRHSISS